MKHLLSFILSTVVLLTSLTACTNRITIDEYDVADAPIAQPDLTPPLMYHAGCLYLSADTVMRYSINSGALTSLCIDPLCFHDTADCPFFMVGTTPEIYGTRLFYEGISMEDRSYPWYMYDIDSGKRQMILTEEEIASFPMLHRGRLYYWSKVPRNNEPADTLSDYDTVLFYLDAETLEKHRIGTFGNTAEGTHDSLITFFGDRILWKNEDSWYTTDLDGSDRQTFGTFENLTLTSMLCDRENGVLYASRKTDEVVGYINVSDGKSSGQSTVYGKMLCILRADGSLTELPIPGFAGLFEVTANYLYYAKFGEPASFSDEGGTHDGALWRCRHDGSGEECVLTAEEVAGAEICRVAGGAAYLRENGALVKLDFATKARDVIFTKET